MCLRQILARLTGKGDNQAPNKQKVAKTHDEHASRDWKGHSNSKGGSRNGDKTSNRNESEEDKAERIKMAEIQKRANEIAKDNRRRHKEDPDHFYDTNELPDYD